MLAIYRPGPGGAGASASTWLWSLSETPWHSPGPPRPPSHTCWPGAPGSPPGRARGSSPRTGPSAPVTDREAPHCLSKALSRLPVGILRQRGDPHPSCPTHPRSRPPRSRPLSRDTARLPRPHSRNPAPPHRAPSSTPRLTHLQPPQPCTQPACSCSGGFPERVARGLGDRSIARPVTVTEGGLAPDL